MGLTPSYADLSLEAFIADLGTDMGAVVAIDGKVWIVLEASGLGSQSTMSVILEARIWKANSGCRQ